MKVENIKKEVNIIKPYLMIITIILFFGLAVFQRQAKLDAQEELSSLRAKISISEDIKTLEARLDSMKVRELEYLKITVSQEKLVNVLIELDKRAKELDRIKKERIAIDVQKLSSKDLSSAFTTLGFPNTIINGIR